MQLKLLAILIFAPALLYAQEKVLNEQEVNFLFNYYNQDGNHSPVTGGLGTEQLNCAAPMMIVNIPFDSVHSLAMSVGLDYYTSASCDNIDKFVSGASAHYLSSASSNDTRGHGDITYTHSKKSKHRSWSIGTGYSQEFDVISVALNTGFAKSSSDENTEIGLKGSMYYDVWKLIFPAEIRNGKEYRFGNEEEDYSLDNRITGTVSFSLAQVISRKLQMILTADLVYQQGILYTPFHRVYFNDGVLDESIKTMFPENLPDRRMKIPIGLRLNYYLADRVVTRFYYRYYDDDFDVKSHTISIEIPIKLTGSLTVYPLYRYYTQSASKYFAPYGEHSLNMVFDPLHPELFLKPISTYYTSDYDNSAFINQKFGLGVRISPLNGIANKKIFDFGTITFKYIELRLARYQRSDGLRANTGSIDCGFVF